jgi:hypothetical protein
MMQLRCVVVYGESARRNAKTIWPVLKAIRDGDKPMKYTVTISRILLGLISVVFSPKWFSALYSDPQISGRRGTVPGSHFSVTSGTRFPKQHSAPVQTFGMVGRQLFHNGLGKSCRDSTTNYRSAANRGTNVSPESYKAEVQLRRSTKVGGS